MVQETFVRALERPPARTDEPWRPWLARVATNLGRDALRRRRRSPYTGPWLPEPVEDPGEAAAESVAEGASPDRRYGLAESVTFAFLVALEALTPQRRAVLLLRDVFDYSARETAEILGMTEGAVKTTLHRACGAMAAYDRARTVPTAALADRTRAAVERFLLAIASRDAAALEGLLAADARATTDAGAEFLAARRSVLGARNVRRLFLGLAEHLADPAMAVSFRTINGLPAVVIEMPNAPARVAKRQATLFDVDAAGRIRALWSVLAPAKLGAVAT